MKRFECKNCEHFRCVVFCTEVLSNKSFECKEKIFKTKWYEIAEEEEKEEIKTDEILNLPSWCKVGEVVYYNDSYYTIVEMNGQYEVKITDGVEDEWVKTSNVQEARLRPFNEKEMRELVGEKVVGKLSERICLVVSCGKLHVSVYGYTYSNEELLDSFTFTNGQPCGVYEHLENGEWVE